MHACMASMGYKEWDIRSGVGCMNESVSKWEVTRCQFGVVGPKITVVRITMIWNRSHMFCGVIHQSALLCWLGGKPLDF